MCDKHGLGTAAMPPQLKRNNNYQLEAEKKAGSWLGRVASLFGIS
jgi:hypothetical protein